MSNTTILFPCDCLASSEVEGCFKLEYEATLASRYFDVALFDFSTFISEGRLVISRQVDNRQLPLIYRGWMMKPDQYRRFYDGLVAAHLRPITPPWQYDELHLFTENYPGPYLGDFDPSDTEYPPTPMYLSFDPTEVDTEVVNSTFKQFMVKDSVKSLKGTSFPPVIDTPITQSQLDTLVKEFIEQRGDCFTGNVVFKEFVNLKRYGSATNEWRAFYFAGKLMTAQRNSSQNADCPAPPQSFVEGCSGLNSPYYTVDFAELNDGSWVVIEGGDGQVSGIAASQEPTSYYQAFGDAAERQFDGYSDHRFESACQLARAALGPDYRLTEARDFGDSWVFTYSRCDGMIEDGGPSSGTTRVGKSSMQASYCAFIALLDDWFSMPNIPIPSKYANQVA